LAKITVLLDNYAVSSKLKSAPGLSMYVEQDTTYFVFDLGGNERALQHNIEVMGVNVELVDFIVVSHAHADHVAGIPVMGWLAPYTTLYIPYGSSSSLGKVARSNGLKPVEVTRWLSPSKDVYITKPLHGPPWEHFIVLDTHRGLIVLSGCMHPGLDAVLGEILKYFNYSKKVYGVVGGLHLANAPQTVIEDVVDKLVNKYDVEVIVPLHCSGSMFKRILSENYPERFVEAGAGSIIEI